MRFSEWEFRNAIFDRHNNRITIDAKLFGSIEKIQNWIFHSVYERCVLVLRHLQFECFFFSSYVEFTDLDELRVEIDEVNVRKENHRNNERYALRRPTFDYIACQSIDTSHLFMVYNWSPVLHHDQRKSMLFLLITFLFCFLLSLLEETSLSGQLRAVEHTANTISLVNNTVSYIALFFYLAIQLIFCCCEYCADLHVCMYVCLNACAPYTTCKLLSQENLLEIHVQQRKVQGLCYAQLFTFTFAPSSMCPSHG